MDAEFGIAFQTDKPPGAYGPLAVAAEAHGFDVVSVFADLLYQPPLPALLEMARATSRESRLDEFRPYLHQRRDEGVTDASHHFEPNPAPVRQGS